MPTDMFDGHESGDQGKQVDEERWAHVRERAQEAVRRASQHGQRKPYSLLNNRPLIIAGGVVVLAIVCLVLYLMVGGQSPQPGSKTSPPLPATGSVTQAPTQSGGSTARPGAAATPGAGNELARALANEQNSDAQSEKWPARLARIGLSLAMAALLGAILAFRPRKNEAVGRPPEAARTQILIALLSSALVLVAAGDIVVALTIVGAAILIRIRPAAFDSREGAGMLISAGIGLACGAGRWEVALILCGFAFAVLWVLDSSPQEDLVRSIDLSVETRSVKETNEVLREVFDKNVISAEFVRVDTSDPTGRTGIVHYSINVKQGTSLDGLSEEIFSEDPDNVLSVNWQQRRWPAVAYR